jgi:hypothetical protein
MVRIHAELQNSLFTPVNLLAPIDFATNYTVMRLQIFAFRKLAKISGE